MSAGFSLLSRAERIDIYMDEANSASVAVARRAGYQFVGEVDRDILAPGHTGRGLVWPVERSAWT
jgi:RimJ/RimL family protein N-acetyltransferase